MDAEQLKKYIEQISLRSTRYNTQKAYAIGNHVAILQPTPKPNPDNRKPVPLPRKAVAMIKGYMAKPGNITYSGTFYESTLKDIFDANDEELTTANELEDALVHGPCYELHWLGTDGKPNFYPIPIDQGYPIYNDEIRPKLIGFVWYRKLASGDELATYYTEADYQEWRKIDKEWIAGEPQPHGYGMVPVNVGQIDRDSRNLFDHVLPLVDLYDKLLSEDVGNELERFNNAIMLMAERIDTVSTDENGRTMVDRLKEMRLIDGLAPDGSDVRSKVAFVTRDVPTSFLEFSANQIERLIYEMLMIVNPNDDSFATASGVAQAYKLLGMEYLCAGIEAYFGRFLQNRIKLIASILGQVNSAEIVSDVTISWKRNLPHNIAETADVMAKMKGIVSDETLLKLLPTTIVPDVAEELKRIAEQQPVMSFDTIPVVEDDETTV